MLELIKSIDSEILLAINGANSDLLDFIMYWASDKMVWVPFYAFLIYLLFLHYKRKAWILILLTILLIAISDQTSVQIFKELLHRLRPCHDPSVEALVRLPDGHCGGKYGFVSSHASNSFALAIFLGFYLGKKIKRFMLVLLIWSLLICYSRVYMGVHFPLDVIGGAAWGALLAVGMIGWGKSFVRT